MVNGDSADTEALRGGGTSGASVAELGAILEARLAELPPERPFAEVRRGQRGKVLTTNRGRCGAGQRGRVRPGLKTVIEAKIRAAQAREDELAKHGPVKIYRPDAAGNLVLVDTIFPVPA